MKKQKKERIELEPLESFNELARNALFSSKKMRVQESKGRKSVFILPNNLISTCIIRIRETSEYINSFVFRKQNEFGEAFDFYETMNCISIVHGCVDSLFRCFNLDLESEYGKKKIFVKSNKKRTTDIVFFKFIRSASSAHPQETTGHKKCRKHKREYYPYALWRGPIDSLDEREPKDFDVKLVSWDSNPNCYGHPYFLYLNEFFEFADYLVSLLSKLNPYVQAIIDEQKEKIRCKRLKCPKSFQNRSEYCLYLRKRLKNRAQREDEFSDGGLLIASHILSNALLGKEFKNYIFKRVQRVAKQMSQDVTRIGYQDIYEGLYLYDVIKGLNVFEGDYVSEKFHEYLERETLREIENKDFKSFKPVLNPKKNHFSNPEWAARLVLWRIPNFYDPKQIYDADSYADLFEITLERIWLKKKANAFFSKTKSLSS